jgi:antirestriction protein ArdC
VQQCPERVYSIVTERICELLENGTVPWHQPWNAELGMPRSLSTGKLYRGVNIWLLGSSMYSSPWWGTYKNITERGGQVCKGEHGTGRSSQADGSPSVLSCSGIPEGRQAASLSAAGSSASSSCS